MIQPQTQTRKYWLSDFTVTESDIESIYNHFLEVEKPQPVSILTRVVMAQRVAEEQNEVKRRLVGRKVYQPKGSFKTGDELVFPALKFAYGKVVATRAGYNPQVGSFSVINVEMNGKTREFAADLDTDHVLNVENGSQVDRLAEVDLEELISLYGNIVEERITATLQEHAEFVQLGGMWFVKGLMAEINIGHLHLAEAVLEVNEGGPLPPSEILVHLDMDPTVKPEVQEFSLNYAILQDERFDEVGPKGKTAWFLRRLEPEGVREVPARLLYTPIPYDRALLSPQLLLLERELDDEWSELTPITTAQPVLFSLTYPHRWAGTLPLSSRIRPLFPPSISPRQRVLFVDDQTGEEMVGWVVQYERYVHGLAEWYEKHGIPVGGFISLQPGPEPGIVMIGYDRRRSQREWVRLATAVDNRIKFELHRRNIACGYDDLLIVGTDTVAAIDALWRRAKENQRTLTSLLAEIFPELVGLNPQNTVHAKTIYSAINMLRRVPPGPVFAELVKNSAFQPVGDHYWQFDKSRVQ